MKRVPPEIDALMWRLAENMNPMAQAEFETRHARYGPELTRRIRMVAELREAGKTVAHRPAFTPRPSRVAAVPKAAVGATLALAVLAVGAVAYVAASGGEKVSTVASPPAPPRIDVAPAPIPPLVQKAPVDPSPVPTPEKSKPEEPKSQKTPNASKPVDLQIKDTALTSAIELVAQAGGLNVTVAPSFPDRKVTFDYGSLTPLDTLKTMGENYGFSVIEEEEGRFLIVPARDQDTERRVGA